VRKIIKEIVKAMKGINLPIIATFAALRKSSLLNRMAASRSFGSSGSFRNPGYQNKDFSKDSRAHRVD
jgi:hypothetical protein